MKLPECLFALAAAMALPAAAMAGGYGSAGVKDATVGAPTTATATVWCPSLKAEIPVTLQAQMDCGSAATVGVAIPKVARERFTTTRRRDSDDDYDGGPRRLVTKDPVPEGPAPQGGPIDKWGRLGQLGVNQSNYHQQGQGFLDKVDAYRNQHGAQGDWSNFNP